jgi:hypothetical protein
LKLPSRSVGVSGIEVRVNAEELEREDELDRHWTSVRSHRITRTRVARPAGERLLASLGPDARAGTRAQTK